MLVEIWLLAGSYGRAKRWRLVGSAWDRVSSTAIEAQSTAVRTRWLRQSWTQPEKPWQQLHIPVDNQARALQRVCLLQSWVMGSGSASGKNLDCFMPASTCSSLSCSDCAQGRTKQCVSLPRSGSDAADRAFRRARQCRVTVEGG